MLTGRAGVRYAPGMSPRLPDAPSRLRPGPATPGGAEPFTPWEVPQRESLPVVLATDDEVLAVPIEDNGNAVSVGYKPKD